MNRYRIWKILKVAVVAALAVGIVGVVVMSLWNWLAPAAFGGHLIGFWQAIGLFVLARLLVGGLRRGGHGHGGHRHGGHWRRRMAAHWDDMSDEERARFGGRRCGPRVDAAGGRPA